MQAAFGFARLFRQRVAFLCFALAGLSVTAAVFANKKAGESGSPPEILKLVLKDTPKPNYGVPVPQRISGRVFLESGGSTTGAVAVSVTDGYSITKTDEQGRFSFAPNPSAVFLYITPLCSTPRDFE